MSMSTQQVKNSILEEVEALLEYAADELMENLTEVDGNRIFARHSFPEIAADAESESEASLDQGHDELPTRDVTSEMDGSNLEQNESSSSSHNCSINWNCCNTEFIYNDVDTFENELGEIYGYYELGALSYNFDMFHNYLDMKRMTIEEWWTLCFPDRCNFVDDLLDDLELADEYKRSDALLAINYLIQGCWEDLETASEQLCSIEENVITLLHCNGFWRIWNFLSCNIIFETKCDSKAGEWGINEKFMENCLNVLITITNVAFERQDASIIEEFLTDLKSAEGDAVLGTLLTVFTKVVAQLSSQSFLVKKLLLLVRNILLLSAGGTEELRRLKEKKRKEAGLKPAKDDTILKCQNIDILQKSSHWNGLKDQMQLITAEELEIYTRNTFEAEKLITTSPASRKGLPWSPKSSIENLRPCMKDCGLGTMRLGPIPLPIYQRVQLLVENLHVPLSTFHLQQEKLIKEFPSLFKDQEKHSQERIDDIFSVLKHSLQSSMNTMMLVLSDATPLSNPAQYQLSSKNGKMNLPFIPRVGGDLTYPVEDSIRQAEVIVKAISTILILLLKHTKLYHIYEFECVASEIMAVNFIPTMLRFFNRDVNRHVSQRPVLEHPNCPFKGINVDLCLYQDLDRTNYSTIDLFGLSWRNTLSHINLLRILNKIVKGKPSRILMLRMFSAHNCFTRCLNVKDSLFQQYTLKLLKLQCKFLDADWKRNNQRIISAIYYKVRHRLLEDWIGEISSSNKMKKRTVEHKTKGRKWPWEYSNAEFSLHQDILTYLTRRFGEADHEFSGEKNTFGDVPESFQKMYEVWVEQEVYGKNIDWNHLLRHQSLV